MIREALKEELEDKESLFYPYKIDKEKALKDKESRFYTYKTSKRCYTDQITAERHRMGLGATLGASRMRQGERYGKGQW